MRIAEPLVKRMDVNWIAVLVPCKDGKEPETIGSAFKITAKVSDAHASAAPLCEGSTSALFCLRNAASCFAGCQVDDLKKAPRLKGLKPNFAHPVLRAVCRRAMTKMEGLSDCQAIKAEEELTIAASKIDIYSKKESFACQSAPICSIPHTSPLVASKLDFAGRPLGERC